MVEISASWLICSVLRQSIIKRLTSCTWLGAASLIAARPLSVITAYIPRDPHRPTRRSANHWFALGRRTPGAACWNQGAVHLIVHLFANIRVYEMDGLEPVRAP